MLDETLSIYMDGLYVDAVAAEQALAAHWSTVMQSGTRRHPHPGRSAANE